MTMAELETMESVILEVEGVTSICRVCLARGDRMKCIDTESPLIQFSKFFTALTTVELQHENKLPNGICQECTDRVLDAYEVRKLAQKSDTILRSIITDSNEKYSDNDFAEPDIDRNSIVQESDINEDRKKCVCPICSKSFVYSSELRRHKQTHAPHYRCATCDKVFGFKSSLLRHERQHERGGRVPCPQCSSLFRDETLLKRHIRYSHQEKKYECRECSSRFGSAAALSSHVRRHTAREQRALRCRHGGCRNTFNFRHQLKRHEATHTGAKMHFCNDCGKGFVQSHHLISHAATHRPEKRIPCEITDCGKTFPTKYALKRHVAVHEKNKFVCKSCSKQFSTSRSLGAHEPRCKLGSNKSRPNKAESKDKPTTEAAACDMCGKVCTRKYLKKHQLNCHKKNFKISTGLENMGGIGDIQARTICKDYVVIIGDTKKDTSIGDIIESNYENVEQGYKHWENKPEKRESHQNLVEDIKLSNEIECNSQEVVKDVVDMMELQSENISNTDKRWSGSTCQGVNTNIEEALPSVSCNNCCQSSTSECRTPRNKSLKNKLDNRLNENFIENSHLLQEKECNSREIIKDVEDMMEFEKSSSQETSACASSQIVTSNTGQTAEPVVGTHNITSAKSSTREMMQGSDCKGFLGNCIVASGSDATSEDCICAKVQYEMPLPEYLTTPLLFALEQQGYYPS